ncbi:ATP-binding protein [Fredinandcohnia sp. 179-A 10B2 NHS]|uniref:ATP-binding protein n=1 Tax=Fredinandcohnia sp. 179-A 10B2 NHS TaxID=3235176 RepID=UPI0039A050F6
MLIEKLLLHVLIVLLPIFVYSVLFENKRQIFNSLSYGISSGLVALFCMIFPYYSFGLNWDLRYVPLVLSFLYGGPLAGGIVIAVICIVRTIMGGEFVYLTYVIVILASIVPWIYSKKFWSFHSKRRIRASVIIGIWPAFSFIVVMAIHIFTHGQSVYDFRHVLFIVSVIGIINIIGIFLATFLIESRIERRIMQQEIQRAEKLNTLGELAASIAHEIRNPLTVVKGFLQLMHNDEKAKNKESYYPLVLSELARAESIISDYLNFAKPQFEKIEEFHIKEVISSVKQLVDPLASKEGIQLVTNFEANPILRTDKNQLKQVLINIIKNGIEATNEGGMVSIELTSYGDRAVIIIRDTGKGMDKEQLERIGTFFYTTKEKGTGVGTTVSTRIVQAMKGTITYKSELTKGTEVMIDLPMVTHERE